MKDTLFAAACEAMANSHSPYSEFPVGAALLADSGAIFSGCNIENASYPEGWCAETSAISHLITAGETQIIEILVVAEKKDRTTPCGGCRQRLIEFAAPNTPVHLCNQQGVVDTITLGDLLPASFDLD